MRGTARLLALVLVSCLAPVLSAVHPHARQQPTFRTGVDLVAVDVRVVDGTGRPVAGLPPDEFVVRVDGNPRTITAAEFIEYPVAAGVPSMSPSAPASAAARPSSNDAGLAPGRTVILFMDEENIRAGYGKWAADATARFVDRLLRDDRVGLVIPKSPTRIAPTTDRAAVKAALSHVVGHMAPIAFAEGIGVAAAFDSHYGNTGKAPNAAVEQIVADAHERTLGTVRSLVTLLDSLATEAGPKTVVLVSEELPVSDHVQELSRFNAEFTRLGEAAARAQAALYVLQLDRPLGDVTDGRTASGEQDSSPARDRDVRSFGLETTSSITGGKRFLVSGKPDAALERVALEISGQYLLGLRTEAADRDGKPHRITVTVKRTGVEVRARQMFTYAPGSSRAGRSQPGPDPTVPPAAAVTAPPPAAPRPPAEPAASALESPAVPGRSPRLGTPDLMSRVGSYIDDYAEKMLVVVGVEHYAQWLQREEASKTIVRGAGWQVVARQTVAEFALVRNASDWDGYRNVYEVDGKPVPEAKDRFQRLFAETPASAIEQSRKIAAESARYNMGALQRNFNVPTVALFFLTKGNQGRFTFTRGEDDQVGGVPVCKVTFQETQKPTLIKTSAGKDMPVRGEAWIDTVSGRVLKTHMQIDSEVVLQADMNAAKGAMAPWQDRERSATRRVKTTASITVTYAIDARLGLLVPSEMLETYEAPMRNPVSGEDELATINCRATYSDFKRFETSGRVITPTPAAPLAADPPPARAVTTDVTAAGAASPPVARGEDAARRDRNDQGPPARSVEDVVARAGQELLRYAEQVSLVIGVEHYAQYKGDESFQRAAKQMLVAEFALVRMKDDWVGFRDVHEVDGKPVADRQDRLRALFLESPATAMSQAQQITRESARYNLGAMQRNFNLPTTALFFLHPSNAARFRYRKDGEDRIDGTAVWKVKYEETQKPTIIRTSAGKDMPLKGTFWIDPVAGRVWKTHMELHAEARLDTGPRASEGFARGADLTTQRIQSSASITVTYKLNGALDLLLPDEMLETYEGPSINSFTGQSEFSRVNCRATYSDFKRFETSGRVITPK
jgi:VWFA-related protein